MVDNTLLIETLAKTKDPYFREKFEDVDWAAVHQLRLRAPMYVRFPDEVNEKWTQGEWIYVRRDGKLSFNEVHMVAVAFANSETAAIYRRLGHVEPHPDYPEDIPLGEQSLLYWERRFHFTSGLTPDEGKLVKKKARELKAGDGYTFISSKG